MMNIAKCFCVFLLLFLILGVIEGRHVIEERSIMSQVTSLSKITSDVSKGDYVEALVDLITMVEDMRNWTWLMRTILRLIRRFLIIIHPVYMWLMRVISSFRGSTGNGGLMGTVQTGIQAGASTLQRALSLFGNIK